MVVLTTTTSKFTALVALLLCVRLVGTSVSTVQDDSIRSPPLPQAPPSVQGREPPTADGHDETNGPPPPCSLYWYNWDVYTGREFAVKEPILESSVVRSFVQQSRRLFPLWNRATGKYLHQVQDQPHTFVYAPNTVSPIRCHSRWYNARVHEASHTILTDRKLSSAQPLILDCLGNHDKHKDVERMIEPVSLDTLQQHGQCLDTAYSNATGSFAKREIAAHQSLIMGPALHLHQAELTRDDSTYEPMHEFTWGHASVPDFRLLPLFPLIGEILHHDAETPNVKLQWRVPQSDEDELFLKGLDWRTVDVEDPIVPWLELVTTRPIARHEPLTMDLYGTSSGNDRSYRQLPNDMRLPIAWRATKQSFLPEIDLPVLKPGQVQKVQVVNNSDEATRMDLGTYQHRVGLPDGFGNSMRQWAEDLGLMNSLRRYVLDETFSLPPMGQERGYFHNGSKWWTRRFGNGWQSNLHMASPDNDEATSQLFEALHEAGFDEVLNGVGTHFNLTTLTAYFPCFLVVTHCTRAHMHWDTEHPTMFNLILPLVQVEDNDDPELILANDQRSLHVPYKYESDAGILLGDYGMHGTAPTDYRDGKSSVRVAMSISMGDFSKDDETVKRFIEAWQDPPYPNYAPGQLHHSLTKRVHWSKDDPSVSIGNPFAWFSPDDRVVDVE